MAASVPSAVAPALLAPAPALPPVRREEGGVDTGAGASEVLVLRAQVAALNADLQRETEAHRDNVARLVRQYPLQNVRRGEGGARGWGVWKGALGRGVRKGGGKCGDGGEDTTLYATLHLCSHPRPADALAPPGHPSLRSGKWYRDRRAGRDARCPGASTANAGS